MKDLSKNECGGIRILSNKFIENVGCQNNQGAIFIYCSNNKEATYKNEIDSHKFGSNKLDEKLFGKVHS